MTVDVLSKGEVSVLIPVSSKAAGDDWWSLQVRRGLRTKVVVLPVAKFVAMQDGSM